MKNTENNPPSFSLYLKFYFVNSEITPVTTDLARGVNVNNQKILAPCSPEMSTAQRTDSYNPSLRCVQPRTHTCACTHSHLTPLPLQSFYVPV